MPTLLQRAVAELGIDVPIYRTEAGPNGTITLYCYGGMIRQWQPPASDSLPPVLGAGVPTPEGRSSDSLPPVLGGEGRGRGSDPELSPAPPAPDPSNIQHPTPNIQPQASKPKNPRKVKA